MHFCLIILAALTAISNSQSVEVVPIAPTFYLGDLATAYANSAQYLYYQVALCTKAQNFTQLRFTISLPNNPGWDTSNNGFVMAQVSKCFGSFDQGCVIAQNYVWNNGINIQAISKLTIDYKKEDNLFIRILSGNLPTQFSLEVQLLIDEPVSYYNWTTNFPFSGTSVSNEPAKVAQYWRANGIYDVQNLAKRYFSLIYCDDDNLYPDSGIDVAVTSIPSAPDSLLTVFACPQSIAAVNCTQNSARVYGWFNPIVAAFNLLECINNAQSTTTDGIYVVVEGYGGSITKNNNFTFQATTRAIS